MPLTLSEDLLVYCFLSEEAQMHPREMISEMRRWWQNWSRANSSLAELTCCGAYEVERMAHDLGLPVSELRQLAEHGPDAADLLARRIAALDLDKDEIAS